MDYFPEAHFSVAINSKCMNHSLSTRTKSLFSQSSIILDCLHECAAIFHFAKRCENNSRKQYRIEGVNSVSCNLLKDREIRTQFSCRCVYFPYIVEFPRISQSKL